jgi:hypothetical protein
VFFLISGGMLYEALIPVDANNTPIAGQTLCAPVALKGVSAFISIAGSGASVYALAQLATGGYSVVTVTPGPLSATGAPTMKTATFLTLPTTTLTPTHLAVAGRAVYVSFAGGATPSYGLWYFSGLPKSTVQTIPMQTAVTSMLALNNSLYLLTSDGALGQLNAARAYASLVVAAALPATTADPAAYTAATPVPTPQGPTITPGTTATPTSTTTTSTIGATFGSGAMLIADPLDSTQMLLSDPTTHRIIQLLAAAGGPGAHPVGQYVYGAPLSDVGDVAMTGSGSTLNAYIWNGSQLVAFTLPAIAGGA